MKPRLVFAPTASGLHRRRMLVAVGAGLVVSFTAGCSLPVIPKRPKPELADALGWIRHADGRYTLFVPRAEMGQNIVTALKQVACEELGVAWDAVAVQLSSTSEVRRVRATVGSESVKDFALPLAQACATLRDALAAGRSTGSLAAEPRPAAELRAFRRGGRVVGQSPVLDHALAIVRGAPLFAADVRRDGMVHGRVLRAPAAPELASSPRRFDEAAARAVPGFVALLQDRLLAQAGSQGLGIVARTPVALDRIEKALAVQWAIEGGFDAVGIDRAIDVDTRRAASPRRSNRVHDGHADETAPWDIDLRIDIPMAAHAPIEPRAAVAEFDADGGLQVWVGTQDTFYMRDVLARRLGIPEDRIVVRAQRVGGAFGGKTICTVELEAALLARAARLPVKVQWTRAQEFAQAFHRPPSSHRVRARLKAGRLAEWQHHFVSSHILFTAAVLQPWMQRLTNVIGDDGVARGSTLPYRAAVKDTGFDLVRLPIHTGPWRGLGAAPNVFAIECGIDDCARKAGIDPVRFRLDHLEEPRLARCLQRAATAAGWQGEQVNASGSLRQARGVACGIYKAMSHAAVVADVEVDVRTGMVRVTRLVCAHDCGFIVNPDQVRAQCEGNLVWGLGMVLVERLPVGASRIGASTFADAPIPRMADVPPMEIVLVDEGEAPSGAGEIAIVAAGAAIANAVRAASGVRPTRWPLTPDRLMAELAAIQTAAGRS